MPLYKRCGNALPPLQCAGEGLSEHKGECAMRKYLFILFALTVVFGSLFPQSALADGGGSADEVLVTSSQCQEQTYGETMAIPSFTNDTRGSLQFILVSHYTYDGDILFVKVWIAPRGAGLIGNTGGISLPSRLWTGCRKAFVQNILMAEYPNSQLIWD